jgi:hypothetical protein
VPESGERLERDRGFADSQVEGDTFDPSVPRKKQPFWLPRSVPQFAFRNKNRLFRAGDRRFESISLQEGVHCELELIINLPNR